MGSISVHLGYGLPDRATFVFTRRVGLSTLHIANRNSSSLAQEHVLLRLGRRRLLGSRGSAGWISPLRPHLVGRFLGSPDDGKQKKLRDAVDSWQIACVKLEQRNELLREQLADQESYVEQLNGAF